MRRPSLVLDAATDQNLISSQERSLVRTLGLA